MKRTMIALLACGLMMTSACASVSEADQVKIQTMNQTVEVMRVKEEIEPGTVLTADMVELVAVPSAYLPRSPVLASDMEEWEGQELQLKVEAGRILEGRDFIAPAGVSSAASTGMPKAESVVKVADASARTAPNGKAEAIALATGNEAYVGILKIAPGAAVPEHADPTEEFIYVVKGSGTLTIDGSTYEIGPDTLVYMPAEATVSFQNGAEPMEVIQIFAGPEPASKYDAWTEAK